MGSDFFLFAITKNGRRRCFFLWDFKAQKYQLPTKVFFLHKVSSLHKCPQKKAMNALPYVMRIYLSLYQSVIISTLNINYQYLVVFQSF